MPPITPPMTAAGSGGDDRGDDADDDEVDQPGHEPGAQAAGLGADHGCGTTGVDGEGRRAVGGLATGRGAVRRLAGRGRVAGVGLGRRRRLRGVRVLRRRRRLRGVGVLRRRWRGAALGTVGVRGRRRRAVTFGRAGRRWRVLSHGWQARSNATDPPGRTRAGRRSPSVVEVRACEPRNHVETFSSACHSPGLDTASPSGSPGSTSERTYSSPAMKASTRRRPSSSGSCTGGDFIR